MITNEDLEKILKEVNMAYCEEHRSLYWENTRNLSQNISYLGR